MCPTVYAALCAPGRVLYAAAVVYLILAWPTHLCAFGSIEWCTRLSLVWAKGYSFHEMLGNAQRGHNFVLLALTRCSGYILPLRYPHLCISPKYSLAQ